MKYQIMIDIMNLLLSKRKLTAAEVAARYGISVRSVYRYVEELNVCGVPVDVIRGRYGGIMIADTYRLPSGYFSREEYAATVNALSAMSSQVSDKAVLSALEKLQQRQKSGSRELMVAGNIIVDGGAWGDAGRFSDKLRVCEQAVNECRSLSIEYISREGRKSKRTVDPQLLVFKSNVWYIYAYCHTKKKLLTFKIGRIKSASFTGESFERRTFTRDEINLEFVYPEEKLIEVTLGIDGGSLADAEEWLGIDSIESEGEELIARVLLPDDDWLVNKILGYGGAVRVLSPEALRVRVAQTAARIAGTV